MQVLTEAKLERNILSRKKGLAVKKNPNKGRGLEVKKYQLEEKGLEAEIIRENQDLEAENGSLGEIALLVLFVTESF